MFNAELIDRTAGSVLKLTFVGQNTQQPIVGELTLKYGTPFNILHGKMTQTTNGTFGELWLQVAATGSALENILADLHAHAITTEVVHD